MNRYAYSVDQETFVEIGEFETREEAVAWAIEELDHLDHEHPFEIAILGPERVVATGPSDMDIRMAFECRSVTEHALPAATDEEAKTCLCDTCKDLRLELSPWPTP